MAVLVKPCLHSCSCNYTYFRILAEFNVAKYMEYNKNNIRIIILISVPNCCVPAIND